MEGAILNKQEWYGDYYIPNNTHIVKKGFDIFEYLVKKGKMDYKDEIFLQDGYIIMNWDIVLNKKVGEEIKPILSYGETKEGAEERATAKVDKFKESNEAGVWYRPKGTGQICNMWQVEGFDTTREGQRGLGPKKDEYWLWYGDVVFYDTDRRMMDDYSARIIY